MANKATDQKPAEVAAKSKDGSTIKFVIRRLRLSDLNRGFLETLSNLSHVGLSVEKARSVFESRPNNIQTFVAVQNGRVIGTASLLIDQKFIHGGSKVGHVEDVSVASEARGTGVGSALVQYAINHAKKMRCYKVMLNCFRELSPFYQQLGFREFNIGMRLDLREV